MDFQIMRPMKEGRKKGFQGNPIRKAVLSCTILQENWAFSKSDRLFQSQTVFNNTKVFCFLRLKKVGSKSSCKDSQLSLETVTLAACHFVPYSTKVTDPVLLCSKDQKSSHHHMTGLSVCLFVEEAYFLGQNITTVLY